MAAALALKVLPLWNVMNEKHLAGRTYAVIGLARAGVPAARYLAERGARVFGYDSRDLERLDNEARALPEIGVELRTGDHNFAGLEECDSVVLSPGLKIHHEPLRSVLEKCMARGVEVIGELELAARYCPAPIIAVTGTKGKSTTVKLIAEMLQACDVNAIRAGNTGIPLIAELSNLSSDSWAVVEVSSFQLERAPTFKPRIGVLLNLLEDHQDYHPSLDQYWTTKLKLFVNQDGQDTAIFNVDDERVEAIVNGSNHKFRGWLDRVRARVAKSSASRVDLAEIPLRGAHNRSNLAAALAAVAAALGDRVASCREQIADAVRNFESLPHRLEIVDCVDGITWVNDSQATIPDAAVRALEAFSPPLTLIAGGRAKLENEDAFDELGQAIARHAHLLLTIGEAAPVIARAACRAGFEPAKVIDAQTLTKAVIEAKMHTPVGGTVVLSPACASFDQFKSFEERGESFRTAVDALKGSTQ